MLERGLWPCLADLSFWVARQRGSHAAPGGRRGAPVSGSSGDTGTLLLAGVFDFFSGVFEVAFGLVSLAFGFERLVVGGFAEMFLDFAGALLGGVLGLVFCAHRGCLLLVVRAAWVQATRVERFVVTVRSSWVGSDGLP